MPLYKIIRLGHHPGVLEKEALLTWQAAMITLTIFFAQLFLVLEILPSTTLKSDTIHSISDFLILFGATLVATYAIRASGSNGRTAKKWFAYAGIGILILGAISVFSEALERLDNPVSIKNEWLMVVGFIGGLGNFWAYKVLSKIPRHEQSHSHKVANLHVLCDMGLSGIVVISGLTGWLFGWVLADAVLSLIAAPAMISIAVVLFLEILDD